MKKRRLRKGILSIILTMALVLGMTPLSLFTMEVQAGTTIETRTATWYMDGGASGNTNLQGTHVLNSGGMTLEYKNNNTAANTIYMNPTNNQVVFRLNIISCGGYLEFTNLQGTVKKVEFTNVRFYNDMQMYVGKDKNDNSTLLHVAGNASDYDFPSIDTQEPGNATFEGSLAVSPSSPLRIMFSSSNSETSGYFGFRDGTIVVTYDVEVEITDDPGHTFTFAANASNDAIIATCTEGSTYHTCGLTNRQVTMPLEANDVPYDGFRHYASLNQTAFNNAGITNIAAILSYKDKSTNETLENPPAIIGSYTATANVTVTYKNMAHPFTLTTDFDIYDGTINCDYPQFSFSPIPAFAGNDVTITFTPLAGEGVETLTMTGDNTILSLDNGITDNHDGTYTFTMVKESLTLGATFSAPDGNNFEQTGTDEYTIKAANGWNWFSYALNSGLVADGFSGKTVKLGTSIESSEMAGTSGHPFKGTFDGQGNTLTFNRTAAEDFCAPFHYINGATISNLHVQGTITGGTYKSLGGLVGHSEGNITINNCRVSTEISTTVSGVAFHGGVIAQWNGTNATCTVTGCVYDGLIYNPDEAGVTASCHGFIGWDYGNYGTITFTDCLFTPSAYGTGKCALGGNCFTFVYPNSEPTLTYNMTNCYYTSILGKRQGRPATTATIAPANLGNATTDHGLVKGYENGFLYDGNHYTPKYGDAVVEYRFNEWNERADVTFNGDGNNLVGVNITEDVYNVTSVTYNRTFTPGATTTVILPFNYNCNGNEGGKFYNFKEVTYDEDQHIWVCKIIAPGEAGSNNVTSLTANTPYLFVPTATKMTFPNIESMTGRVVTLLPTTLNEYGGATTDSNWNFYGTYTGKEWTELSKDYGFAAQSGTAVSGEIVVAGQFVRYATGASIRPMRCYLRYAGTSYFVGDKHDIPWWDSPDNVSAADTYKQISFSAGEGSGTKDVIYIPENRNYILPECNFSAPEGKVFKEWSVQIGNADAVAKNPGDKIEVTADTTVTAVWATEFTVYVIAKDVDGNELAADITGTGEYFEGTKASLSAKVVEGYNFKGWYLHSDEKPYYTGNPISTANSFEYTVEGHAYLTAVYEALGKATITINCQGGYTVNGSEYTTQYKVDNRLGTKLTLVANGDKFAYWENGYGMVLSRSRSYTVTVTGADTITAVFDTVATNKATLVFKSYYDQIMARIQLASGETMDLPSVPYRNGYVAQGWDLNGDGKYDGDDTLEGAITRGLAAQNSMIVINPVYEAKQDTFAITVNHGTITSDKAMVDGKYVMNSKITVTADAAPEGQKFSHWKDGQDETVSYNASYQFFADRDLVLTAVYVADTEIVEAKGTTEIISMSKNIDAGTMTFVSLSTVPEGFAIKKAGLIITGDADIANSGDGFNDSTARFVRGEEWSGTSYRYTWTITGMPTGVTAYARGYLVYVDKEGNTHTIYGTIVSQVME